VGDDESRGGGEICAQFQQGRPFKRRRRVTQVRNIRDLFRLRVAFEIKLSPQLIEGDTSETPLLFLFAILGFDPAQNLAKYNWWKRVLCL